MRHDRTAEAMLDTPAIARLETLATRILERRTRSLESQFGWTHLRASVHTRPLARQLVIDGEAVVARLIGQLHQELSSVLPRSWALVNNLRPSSGPWRSLGPGITRLQRQLPAPESPATLSTELLPGDGPVRCLAQRDSASLVRTVDGTVGWTTSPLGP